MELSKETKQECFIDGHVESLRRIAELCESIRRSTDDSVLHTLVRNMQDLVMVVDRNLNLIAASDTCFDYFPTPQCEIGLPTDARSLFCELRDINGVCVCPSDMPHLRCLRGETIKNELFEVTRPSDGQKRCISINAKPIHNHQGQVEMMLIACRDVTDIRALQLRTEQMLAENKQQSASLKMLIENIPAGVALMDSDLRIIMANKTYARYFEIKRFREGVFVGDAIPRIRENGVLDMINRAMKANRAIKLQRFRYDGLKSGPTYWSGSIIPMKLHSDAGPISAVALIAIDVTEEIAAQERLAKTAALAEQKAAELEAERARLDAIIQSIPVALAVVDMDWRLVTYNEALKEMATTAGLSDLLRHDADPSILTNRITRPDGTPLNLLDTPVATALRGELHRDEIICLHIPGQPFRTYSTNSAPIKNAHGKIAGAIVAISDITEQTRVRAQLQEIYQREHTIAEKLQSSFLPEDLPLIEGFAIGHSYRPALDESLVGGDFYDVFRLADGVYGIVIADVAGKGLKASIYTAMTKHMLRAYAFEDGAPDTVLNRLNDALSKCTHSEVFVTLVYGVLDSRARTWHYANAGHELPVFYRKSNRSVSTLEVTGRALALMSKSTYSCRKVSLEHGDMIMLYTDGISDAGWGGNRLGQDRLMSILVSKREDCVQSIADSILEEAMDYSGGKLSDDAALIIIRSLC